MATTYVGYFRVTQPDILSESLRETGGAPRAFADKVNSFLTDLPNTCKWIGTWNISGGSVPSVIVVQAESYEDLQHINRHYQGWLSFEWHPAVETRRDL